MDNFVKNIPNNSPLIQAIHTAVKGRARYKVSGLHHSKALKNYLEFRLAQSPIIEQVQANPITGNVLIIFQPYQNHNVIADLVERIVLDYREKSRELAASTVYVSAVSEATKHLHASQINPRKQTLEVQNPTISLPRVESVNPGVAEFNTSAGASFLSAYRSTSTLLPERLKSLPVDLVTVAAGLSIATGGLADALVIIGVFVVKAAIDSNRESQSKKIINETLVKRSPLVKRDSQLQLFSRLDPALMRSTPKQKQLTLADSQLVLLWGTVGTLVLGTGLLHVYGLDKSILLSIKKLHTPILDRIMLGITFLGEPIALLLVCLVGEMGLLHYNRRSEAKSLGIIAAGAIGLNYVLKVLFGRTRPALWNWIVDVHHHSFPSGHAMVSIAIYGFLGYILAEQFPQQRERILVSTAGLIAAIGFSRLYLGVHWPTDVVAGYAVGLAWLIAVLLAQTAIQNPTSQMDNIMSGGIGSGSMANG